MDFVHTELARQLLRDRRSRFEREAGRPFHPPTLRRAGTRSARMGPLT